MFDILLLAVIVGIIFARLFKILGSVDEDSEAHHHFAQKIREQYYQAHAGKQHKKADINIPSAIEASLSEQDTTTIKQFQNIDSSFNLTTFIEGAQRAFEMIIHAFNEGDKDTLAQLLTPQVYKEFIAEIERRNKAKEFSKTTIVSIKSCSVEKAELSGTQASITLQFITEQISTVGEDSSPVMTRKDLWTFTRDLSGRSKIWQLASTDLAE
jgi:predicted lipid-binding transport protein (Tim44 family)